MTANNDNSPISPTRPPAPTLDPSPRSVWQQQWEFILKELRETLRDRRTTITLMAMPLLLYPLLGLGLRFVAFQQAAESRQEYSVALETEQEFRWLGELLQLGEPRLNPLNERLVNVQFFVPQAGEGLDLEGLVRETAATLGIRVAMDTKKDRDGNPIRAAKIELLQNSDSPQSRDAADYIERRLNAANIELITRFVQHKQLDFKTPVESVRTMVQAAKGGSAILGLLPLILLLMTVTGGVYPAIDLTAGERERNTLETLMALPVPRFRLLVAKFVAVFTVTMLTGIMNLVAMFVTLLALQLDQKLLGDTGMSFGLGLKLLMILTAFGLLYSAVLLLLTSSAKSFKEAQAYLIPLLLLSIAPGLVILMPGWDLASGSAVIPLVNMLLLAREVLEGTVQPLPAFVAMTSTILYGVAALVLAAQVFGADAVAVGSRGTWGELLQRPKEPARQPSITAVCLGLAATFPAYFVASGLMSRGTDVSPSTRLLLSAILTIALFLGLPWMFLTYQRVRLRDGLRLYQPHWTFLVAAVLLGLSTWPGIFELIILLQSWGIRGIDLSRVEDVEQLLAGWKSVPLWLTLFCLDIVPGVCEECFFRGYFFNGLKSQLHARWTIILSAIAFGLFHVVLAGGAAPERLLPSTLMGLLLGWLAWRSGSLIPSILLHVVHNCSLLWIANSRDMLAEWNIGQAEQQHLPWMWLLPAGLVFALGFCLIPLSKSFSEKKE
jgi:sodium transport system permease protein